MSFVQKFVNEQMSPLYTDPPALSVAYSYKDSAPHIPLVFILSPGVDPLMSIYQFADEKKMNGRMNSVSLGQMQGPIAINMIENALQSGSQWVILQNCHLAPSFLNELEKICLDVNFLI